MVAERWLAGSTSEPQEEPKVKSDAGPQEEEKNEVAKRSAVNELKVSLEKHAILQEFVHQFEEVQ